MVASKRVACEKSALTEKLKTLQFNLSYMFIVYKKLQNRTKIITASIHYLLFIKITKIKNSKIK